MHREFLTKGNKTDSFNLPHDLTPPRKASLVSAETYNRLRIPYRRLSYLIGKKTSPYTLYETEGIIFIHIPKNAGTFINGVVYPSIDPSLSTKINAHHSTTYLKRLDEKRFEKLPKFAILRHPASRLESAFNYLKYSSPFVTDQRFAQTSLATYTSLSKLCEKATEQDLEKILSWPHFQPQISYICDKNGVINVDALTVIEGLEVGLSMIGKLYSKTWNVERTKQSRISEDLKIRKFVEKHYKHDLNLWREVESSQDKYVSFE